MKTIKDIQQYLKELLSRNQEIPLDMLELLKADHRPAVKKLLLRYMKNREKNYLLQKRWHDFRALEKRYRQQGLLVAGVDEAGRGPLAGPVVAAAVILPEDCYYPVLDDSKKLTESKRNQLYEQIKQDAIAWAVGISDVAEIEQLNILNATKLAMLRAVKGLKVEPKVLLIDALTLADWPGHQERIIDGDALHACIAAASVIAKVTRDQMMAEIGKLFPEYGFEQHKGYGTAAHIAALKKYGPCPQHRWSFVRKFLLESERIEARPLVGNTDKSY
ncbi:MULTISPECIES: ribonuclease HII [Carboxydocella]|uniref:Ribonuclease HII n=2 Tax=Carboxydocella TaxID=178898 RepID=A0A1T4LJT4_9FIRM|nr:MULTISPECIES: ribonuclease HII [Carboxydocella]AVX20496.1 RNase HII [Carboxydocella thermautotrophica]AVX30917.1 RNase HII [Carboxydocella thermautotrophica]SJZ54999.1 RNase HII [Carboxydocella sporoproducens DSM 16521]GAW29686.1 ribonuclease HII [Carboxydocella sp. ULO1]GAW31422.1 ribonuclease HII [Carboxydocella sp. JDF658]